VTKGKKTVGEEKKKEEEGRGENSCAFLHLSGREGEKTERKEIRKGEGKGGGKRGPRALS